jgi:hypothetical protein
VDALAGREDAVVGAQHQHRVERVRRRHQERHRVVGYHLRVQRGGDDGAVGGHRAQPIGGRLK